MNNKLSAFILALFFLSALCAEGIASLIFPY
uniref:Uncharacterized protein n=1 Tax=Siphoviridae sp. ctMgg26 TaxID=2825462 RepID=A0A8S5Q0D5_9CAUD|nr:MAG TPA: hypothetical protein [Siphoviridae sp. ctMgg26]